MTYEELRKVVKVLSTQIASPSATIKTVELYRTAVDCIGKIDGARAFAHHHYKMRGE